MKNTKVIPRAGVPWAFKAFLTVFLFFNLSSTASSGPWIDSGDQRLRHHIVLLADNNIITVPVTTWPLMWAGIIHDVNRADYAQLDEASLWSLRYVKHAFTRQTEGALRFTSQLSAGEDSQAIRYFGDHRREKSEVKVGVDWMSDTLAVHLAAGYADQPTDGEKWRADGSYISYALGNWAFTAGAIDRWWGPGWHSSLTVSNNTRPIPGLSLQRRSSDAFGTRWLSW
ncbi:capsule assembly Wzi family protein, partial [Pseudomonadales bacterium]|nr:capsule assembly Wzi family protein [Pseudomonadales bacterium]